MSRDGSNRITPEAQQGLNLQPAAAPVNQEIKYKFDASGAERTKSIADGLAKLGKGLVDIDPVLERAANQTVAKAQLEAGTNKDQWNEVSKNIKGMAMFNPYNKDAHERLKSENICKATLLEAMGKPDFEKLSPEDANKYLQDAKQRTIEALQKSGVKPSNYSKALLDFDTKMKAVDDNYQIKHQAYQYKLTNNSYQHHLATDIEIAMTSGKNKSEALQNVLSTYSERMTTECGIPSEQQATNMLAGIQNYIASNPTGISSAELLTTLKGLKINGTDIAELIPDYEVKMKQIVRTAQRADYDDRALELSNAKLIEETKSFNALQEFGQRFRQSDGSFETARQLYGELSSKYGLSSSSLTFMGTALESANKWNNFNVTVSDAETVNELGVKAFVGTLTQDDLTNAVEAGKLNFKDAFTLNDAQRKSREEGQTDLKKLVNNLKTNVVASTGAFYGDFSRAEKDEINKSIARITNEEAAGKITATQAYNALQKYNKRVQQLASRNKASKNSWQSMLNGSYRAAAAKAYYNKYGVASVKESTDALKALGMIANKWGGARDDISANDTVGTVRAGRDGRLGTADDYYHVGTDINGVQVGNSILAPAQLTLVTAGYDDTMGHYALFKDTYGRYVQALHLNESLTHVKVGSVYNKGSKIGTVGNSGRAANNGCCHVEFWTSDRQLIDPIRYLKGKR